MIGIGIDTGGTYTDGVVYDTATQEVLAKTKSLTTKDDLSRGISRVLKALPADKLQLAERVALSTTLATNACVEGKGGRAKLIIVGTTDAVLHRVNAPATYGIPYEDTLAVDYSGSYDGSVVNLPDWDALYAENKEFFDSAESFGIAGLYALNNGGAVEKSGYEFLTGLYPDKPVVMATTVATSSNVIERGATALLNARLIPVIRDFMDAVRRSLDEMRLDLPIMIVRSDGSLMSEELARVRPVETVLCGPAASVSGAQSLSHESESLIIDIGGTTSDISIVHGGKPVFTEGIRIGGWRTQISGVFIDTIGLGGDSAVRFDQTGGLVLSPRRATPMCIAASRWPKIKADLQYYLASAHPNRNANYEFFYLNRKPRSTEHFNRAEKNLIDLLHDGPVQLYDDRIDLYSLDSNRLEAEGIVMRVGITPTDAMHIKNDFGTFDREASYLAIQCLLKSLPHDVKKEPDELVEEVADRIYDLAKHKLYNQVARVMIQDRYPQLADKDLDGQLQLIIDESWKRFREGTPASPFDIDLTTRATLVGIGAPTHILLPDVAKAFGTSCVITPHHEVANAIGAVHSQIVTDAKSWIVPNRDAGGTIISYQVHSADFNEVYETFPEAREAAVAEAERAAKAEARRRGAIGELYCTMDSSHSKATGSDGVVVTLQWSYQAHVQTVANE